MLRKLNAEDVRKVTVEPLSAPRTVQAKRTVGITIRVSNQSDTDISSGDPFPVLFSYHWLDAKSNEVVVVDGLRTPFRGPLKAGEVRTIVARVACPPRAGSYLFRPTLVQEGVLWFWQVDPRHGPDIPIEVSPEAGGNESSRQKILVIGNCSAQGIAQCLRVMTGADVDYRVSLRSADLNENFECYDLIFCTHFSDRPLHEAFPSIKRPVVHYPRVAFPAFHPDCVMAYYGEEFVQTPLGLYNSAIVLSGWKDGLSAKRINALFRDDVYQRLGFYNFMNASIEGLIREGEATRFPMGDLVKRWMKAGCFMHSNNHPKLFVLADLARVLAEKAGLTIRATRPEDYLADRLMESAVWPVYPELGQRLGLPGSYDFKAVDTGGANVPSVLSLEEFVEESLSGYALLDPVHVDCRRIEKILYKGLDGSPPEVLPGSLERRSTHPYSGLPPRRFWKAAVDNADLDTIDPVNPMTNFINRNAKVATGGSCFAQHISRSLQQAGLTYYVAETAPVGMAADLARQHNYGVYSARYGNIYTARQLVQLFDRAYGHFKPAVTAWERSDGTLADPFRPEIEPSGFAAIEALERDRDIHFRYVRSMFETLDVFVFTLGLTEAWRSTRDGAVFPLAPGVSAGVMDWSEYEFVNFTVEEVTADLRNFVEKLRSVNPSARVLLTVSPVPLAATFEDRHVVTATTYSKSVLRVAAEAVSRSTDEVTYFPAFEIIAGHHNRGAYYENDLRHVRREGVDHVMNLFLKHCTTLVDSTLADEIEALQDVVCEEERLVELTARRQNPVGEFAESTS